MIPSFTDWWGKDHLTVFPKLNDVEKAYLAGVKAGLLHAASSVPDGSLEQFFLDEAEYWSLYGHLIEVENV